MAAPDDNNPAGGILNGHGVGIAMAAIFVGTGLVVAFVASDGTIFGLNFRSTAGSGTSVNDNNVDSGNANSLSRDLFDEGSSGDINAKASPSPTSGESAAITPSEQNSTTLSEEQRQLLAISNFHWDSIAGKYITSNKYTVDKIQQDFTKQKPADPETEPLALSDKVVVNVDRNRDSDNDMSHASATDVQNQIDEPVIEDDEERSTDDVGQSTGDNNDSGSENDQSDESDSGDSSGDISTSIGTNSTDTNSTSIESSLSSGDGNSTVIDVTIS